MQHNRIVIFLCCLLALLCPMNGCTQSVSAANDEASAGFLDELVFLGDSTTAHMEQRSTLQKHQIWAAKSRYLNLDSRITYAKIVAPDTGEEETIAAVAARIKPRYLVVTLGVDYGVYYYRDKPEIFRLYYEKLLDAIQKASPDTVLLPQSVFPVGKNAVGVTREMVANANGVIRRLAADRGLYFIDQWGTLADSEGYLRPEYCYSEDGLHLTASAYRAVLDHILSLEDEIGGGK